MGRAKAKDVLTIRSEIYDFAKISERKNCRLSQVKNLEPLRSKFNKPLELPKIWERGFGYCLLFLYKSVGVCVLTIDKTHVNL